ncbi:response regulator transcription factor [Geodermatophilus sp. SYSU D00684]
MQTCTADQLVLPLVSLGVPPSATGRLSEQERTVLALIGEGLTNRQIGERMFLAAKIVKNHVSHLLAKLGLERRTQAAVLATRLRDHRAADAR